jgi:hypothetical protein
MSGLMSNSDNSPSHAADLFHPAEVEKHIAGFVDCFNRGLFFEAHEVLETIWLPHRNTVTGPFFKGLIQFAGAFVHVQKQRSGPAKALFKLSAANLANYPEIHFRIPVNQVRGIINDWLARLESLPPTERMSPDPGMKLRLVPFDSSLDSNNF